MKDFASAWKHVQQSGDIYSDLFATSIYRNRPIPRTTRPQKSVERQIASYAPAPTWSEYSNPQNHRYQYSPMLHKQRQELATQVFSRALEQLSEYHRRG